MMDNGSSGFGAVYNDKIRAGWDLCWLWLILM
jgi:hypothetical protein